MALLKVVKIHGANAGYHRVIVISLDPRDKVNYCLYSYANKTAADAGEQPLTTHHTTMPYDKTVDKDIIEQCYTDIKANLSDKFTTIDLTGATDDND